MRGKRRPSDGRTQAYPALSSVGIPQRVCLPPPPCLCPCPPRLRASFPVQTDHAKENQVRLSFFSPLLSVSPHVTQNGRFVCEPSVFSFQAGRAGKRLFPDKSTVLQCLLFLFFKKRNRSPLEEKKTSPFKKRNRPPFQASCVMPFALHPEAPSATIEDTKPTEVIPCIACIAEPS